MSRARERKGFAEQPQHSYSAELRDELLRKLPRREKLKLADGGRIVIPAAMREEMGVKPGDTLVAHVENGELRLISRRMALRRVQEKARQRKEPGESVVDEFLAERRAMWGES
ncbi:AbrB/MazE/SpoVT family DNA-binding domain-containing protein [Aquamicrobium sp. LC103]|uniref:AbrB/MazE/SpoVT family DNA-binding domain-containing protein n=1 Tax=Aquamicrobium sp. LC103 TaxID=1120658 RepID=UPI00063EBE14|nr:AbrB/MazE/SpoVT family DNA-binding domain-containing protein [Aquamicrobium sp. LC103]TKT81277.1 AbrB/MazE/SpoVT family DNA-binding domain-containing protein [Aquamicrobium sp. LC103]